MAGKAVKAVSDFLAKLPLKAPWKWTGVASSVEFQSHLIPAPDYRVPAPASQPVRAVIPHALPERVYDIKYYVRDTRREGQLVGGTNKRILVHSDFAVNEPDEDLDEDPDTPVTMGPGHRWKRRTSILDYDNNGYT